MTIESLRGFIKKSRLILWVSSGALTPLFIWSAIAFFSNMDSFALLWVCFLAFMAWIITLALAFETIFLKLKTYKSQNHTYTFYLGFFTLVLFCDDVKVDMFKGQSFGSVNLEYDDEQGEKISIKVSQLLCNSSTIKINGEVVD